MTVERFTAPRKKPTMHDKAELRECVDQLQIDDAVAFAGVSLMEDGTWKIRWIVLPSAHRTDLFAAAAIMQRELLNSVEEMGDE